MLDVHDFWNVKCYVARKTMKWEQFHLWCRQFFRRKNITFPSRLCECVKTVRIFGCTILTPQKKLPRVIFAWVYSVISSLLLKVVHVTRMTSEHLDSISTMLLHVLNCFQITEVHNMIHIKNMNGISSQWLLLYWNCNFNELHKFNLNWTFHVPHWIF